MVKNLLVNLDCAYSRDLLLRVLRDPESTYHNLYNIYTRDDVVNYHKSTNPEEEFNYEESVAKFIKEKNIEIQWDEYENVPWDTVMSQIENPLRCNYYCIRKGLIRKAQFGSILNRYVTKKLSKNEKTHLKKAIPETHIYELDDVEYFDESLYDIYEVVQSLENNEKIEQEGDRNGIATWILKPSLTNKGAEIFIFNSLEQLQNYFTTNFEQQEDNDDEDEESNVLDLRQLREWVIQKYVDRPLLLCGGRKFHMRVYVLAVGALKVYVYDQILALFALRPFKKENISDTFSHITNTCVQVKESDFKESESVKLFWNLANEDSTISTSQLEHIFQQVKDVTGEMFDAVSGELAFMPLPHCFELFGLDFLVDEDLQVYLLEVNAGPDFKQTGKELDSVIYNLFNQTANLVLDGGNKIETNNGRGTLHQVLDKTTFRGF
ncbi:tubulin tyrosine ligase [Naegleria gruberi]|uniref:Tubulin tyrosine ligase n=1 Tax=Naegleria gruberi TaxID=5762 RepID=D2V7F0_NAEGR|nr:tubulin tyrosine ligase [Naegleria gruberi]EFC47365.1 tubulin tyrosine ligase [Naegleria gruberi]|eukprot:XP_002680109.1 tubulin tyrosine ligase [Naegleria gruberi strain NEG-M]